MHRILELFLLLVPIDLSDQYFFNFQNFITPSTLYYADASNNTFKAYKSLPAFFDASKYEDKAIQSENQKMAPWFLILWYLQKT